MGDKTYIGIDPGASGAIAIIPPDGRVTVMRLSKVTDKEIWEFLNGLSFDHPNLFCVKEKVWAMPGDGERKMGAAGAFKFGDGNGFLRGMLVASGIPFTETTPQTWQKYYGMKRDKEESQPDYKKRLRQKAEQLYPSMRMTADIADALLIAHFTKNVHP